jgi:hypothetical protein
VENSFDVKDGSGVRMVLQKSLYVRGMKTEADLALESACITFS